MTNDTSIQPNGHVQGQDVQIHAMNAPSWLRPTVQVNLWASLAYGGMLLLAPDLFCDLLNAEPVNTAWLRTIGAALLGTNVLGSWLWLDSPERNMGRVQFATAGLEALAMSVSLALGEFTASNLWMVQASVVLAWAVTAGLWAGAQAGTYGAVDA